MFELPDFSKKTVAKQQVDELGLGNFKIDRFKVMTGNLLGTLGNDLSGGPKFAYELLQNAHDTGSADSPVNLYVFHEGEYLVWAHSGSRLFTPDDVEGISNAARSNADEIDHKSKNLGMIGYKGIGFKAVLARADKVHIISGDFSFGFDQGETRKRLASYIAKDKTVEYLWQVLPYWMPIEGDSQRLLEMCYTQFQAFKRNFPALDCSAPKTFFIMHIPGFNFETEFSCLKEDLSWMLFLDNFSKINFLTEQVCLDRKVVRRSNNRLELELIHQTKDAITKNAYLILSKEIIKTAEINRELAKLTGYQCPQRLKDAESTIIKIAFSLSADRQLQAVPMGQLFVGLPLAGQKDDRQLVHIQANFLLDTRRYSLTDDGPWNNFLLRSAGRTLVEFLAEIAGSDEPCWNQVLRVFPRYEVRYGQKTPVFYEAINDATKTIAFVPANHDRKVLLRLDAAYLDETIHAYGMGFHYHFTELPVVSVHGRYHYSLTLPHRDLKGISSVSFINRLSLDALLKTDYFDYFKTDGMQIKLLTYLASKPELINNQAVRNKKWILARQGQFVSLNDIYIPEHIYYQQRWYELCQNYLDLPCMQVSEKLNAETRKQLADSGCKKLGASEYDIIMMERLVNADSIWETRAQHYFSNRDNQIALLTFIAAQLEKISSWQFSLLASKKLVLVKRPGEVGNFENFQNCYLPGVVVINAWYSFCRNFLKLPIVEVADVLSKGTKEKLSYQLNCQVLSEVQYDQRMCQYFFDHQADIAQLQQMFATSEMQYHLIRLFYGQSTAGAISAKNLTALKKMAIFKNKAGEFKSCEFLFIPALKNTDLNRNYSDLLQLFELAVTAQLDPIMKTWLSEQLGMVQADQADFETRFFQLISSADARQEQHLQRCFSTPESQLTLLTFMASPAGEKYQSQIQEKSLILANVNGQQLFKKPREIFTLSRELTLQDVALVKEVYPDLPLLVVVVPDDQKKLLEKQLNCKCLSVVSLATKLGDDIKQSYSTPSDSRINFYANHSAANHHILIVAFLLRHYAIIDENNAFGNFSYLPLKTKSSTEQLRPAFSLYLSSDYHPKDPLDIVSDESLQVHFLSPYYQEWANAQGIGAHDLKKIFLKLGVAENLHHYTISSISMDNFQKLEPQLVLEFIQQAQVPKSIKHFSTVNYRPLLYPLVTGQLSRHGNTIEQQTALEYLVRTLKKCWEKKPSKEGSVTTYYSKTPSEYVIGLEFIRFAILKLVPDLADRYYTATDLQWAHVFLPRLNLQEDLELTPEEAEYLRLRRSLDKTACELLLERIPQVEGKVAAQYYDHYYKIFKVLLTEQSHVWRAVLNVRLPVPCYLLAENDTWQPNTALSYLAFEVKHRPSPTYLKKWPTDRFSLQEQEQLAKLLGVKVLKTDELTFSPVEPIIELPWVITLLMEAGLPYLALAKAQEEMKVPQTVQAELQEQLIGWSFKSAISIQVKSRSSGMTLQETNVYVDQQGKNFYIQKISSAAQERRTQEKLIEKLSGLLSLGHRAQEVLSMLFMNINENSELDSEGLVLDMQDEGYDLSSLGYQATELDENLVSRFSRLSMPDAPAAAIEAASNNLLSLVPSVAGSPASIGFHFFGGGGRRSGGSRRSRHSGGSGFGGMVASPNLTPRAGTVWEAENSPVRRDHFYSGGMEPVSHDVWNMEGLDEVKPSQLDFRHLTATKTKAEASEAISTGYLQLKLDPVAAALLPALPVTSAATSQTATEFFEMILSGIQLSASTDGIGYWGEAVVFGWLLIQKYGSKFEEPIVENIGQGHCVLRGKTKDSSDADKPRLSRSYHMIWHRQAGELQSPHDITVIKHYDQGEQKLSAHEVKATKYSKADADGSAMAKVSRNQLSEMASYGNQYRFYRVYSVGTANTELEYFRDPAALLQDGKLLVRSLGL